MSITELIWTFENGDITVDEFKQDLLSLLLNALPGKKDESTRLEPSASSEYGHNQAIDEAEANMRKALK